jgi:2-keto-4-pentenoate hydratase/2-oxohepta-3-ene-1,7-dioic acid hydratase in catechol pathway
MRGSRKPFKLLGKFEKGEEVFMGVPRGDEVLETTASCLMDVIEHGVSECGRKHPMTAVRVLPPVDKPSKIICIGLNYRSHIREMGAQTPKEPIIFTKPPSSIIGPGDPIVLPAMSRRVDYEGESALVIGKAASHTSKGNLHIFGYTCFNDVTARDLQKADMDWTRAKGFDTFAPVGPFVSSRCPRSVTTRLNGEVVQSAPLSDRVFDDRALVEYISQIMTLEPGDMIATGTPSGIAPMKAGDIVEVELDGVGILRNKVVKSR